MNIGNYTKLYSEDLRLKNYAESTIENYKSQLTMFLADHEKTATKPSEISERQIKEWLLRAKTINSRKHRLSAIKLFYKLTGKQPLKLKHIEYPRSEKKLPIVLSQEEVKRMFEVCENTKHKAILAVLYSCGLRVSELINLKWEHLDRSRKIINIIAAKGKKDRQVPLSVALIKILEAYWLEYRSIEYIFSGQLSSQYSERSVLEVVKQLAEKAGINKRVYTHLMRHNCFTHMLEASVDISLIQKIAGHSNPKTTQIYTHISHNLISSIKTPLDNL